jgi:formylglycine-generating enzyme
MLETVPVPGGAFLMGSEEGRDDERPVHETVVSPFHLGRTAVTRAQYEVFLTATRAEPPQFWQTPAFGSPDLPVVGVSWPEAVAYAEWLSAETGLPWRLPTEAEWERAARGGLRQASTAWGEAVPPGEIPAGGLEGPWPVGRGTPNGFGLFDMGTIVHEWCLDWYDPSYYASSPRDDPRGPSTGTRRASRGGSWRHHVRWSSPAARSSLPPVSRYADYGFRLVCAVPATTRCA